MPASRILLIEGSDFQTFPAGGQLSMVKALMKVLGPRLALVGMSKPAEPLGRWTEKQVAGTSFPFFSVARRNPSGQKPLLPARLTFYAGLRRYKAAISSLGCKLAFVQAPEALLAVSGWDWESLCFWFPGVENQLRASRYFYARPLAGLFDRALFSALEQTDTILAAADENAIQGLVARSQGRLSREKVIQFPTCVDTSLFHPLAAPAVRSKLGIPDDSTVFVTTGRIGRFKGWPLLVDAFQQFLQKQPRAQLFFVGDGEDKPLLQAYIEKLNLAASVKVTGFQKPAEVASYLNAADVVVSGSLLEGWSVSMLEALACGKPIVSTEVSGVSAMIRPGQNGFIVPGRRPADFAAAMQNALLLPDARQISTLIAGGFDLTHLRERLAKAWHPVLDSEYDRSPSQTSAAAAAAPAGR